jgi:large subunit ribosomal protein L25
MDQVILTASPRTALGKKNGALRRDGAVPLHLYGLNGPSLNLQATLSDIRVALKEAGVTIPVRVQIQGGEDVFTVIREIARHPVSGELRHVDLLRVDPETPVVVPVPVRLVNASTAPGIRGGAGVVTQGMYEVTVRAKPFDVPKELIVECMKLESFDSAIKVSGLAYPQGVQPAGNVEALVAWIQAPRVTKVDEPVAAAEGAVLAEGEVAAAAPADGAATPAAAGAKGAAPAGAKGAAPAAGPPGAAAPAQARAQTRAPAQKR